MFQVMSLLIFFVQAEDFAYKIDLVTGGVVVIGVVTGDRSFICRFFFFYMIYCYIVQILGFHMLLCIVGMMGRTLALYA